MRNTMERKKRLKRWIGRERLETARFGNLMPINFFNLVIRQTRKFLWRNKSQYWVDPVGDRAKWSQADMVHFKTLT